MYSKQKTVHKVLSIGNKAFYLENPHAKKISDDFATEIVNEYLTNYSYYGFTHSVAYILAFSNKTFFDFFLIFATHHTLLEFLLKYFLFYLNLFWVQFLTQLLYNLCYYFFQ